MIHIVSREEYPSPPSLSHDTGSLHAPYSQVPYHDARVTTPAPRERVLHYMAPPNQVTSDQTRHTEDTRTRHQRMSR